MTWAKFLSTSLTLQRQLLNFSARSPVRHADPLRRCLSRVTQPVTQPVTQIQRELPHLGPRQPGSQLAGVETVQEEVLGSSSHKLLTSDPC